MIGLTFLGLTDYKETTYQFNSKLYCTNLFPLAFAEFFQFDQLKVVVTKESKDKHFGKLETQLKNKLQLEDITVPSGESEKDLWDMFDRIVESIPPESQIVVDVTHGFRSMPILILAICVYLKTILKVQVSQIVYGAFDARNKETNVTPVFDLTPFLFLLDWTFAIDKFIKLGDADELSKLLQKAHQTPYRQREPEETDLPKKLKTLANLIDDVTVALNAIRPKEATEKTLAMVESMDVVAHEVEKWAKPFSATLNKAKVEYKPIAASEGSLFSTIGMKAQFNMVKWYIEKRQFVQAITLAREWIISRVCLLKDLNPVDMINRENITTMLGQLTHNLKTKQEIGGDFKAIPINKVAEVWASLVNARNDIDHAGMRAHPCPAKKLIKNIMNICQKLEGIQ